MNKQTKLILLIAFLMAAVQFTVVYSLADKDKPRIEITPAVEVVNKFPTVAMGTVCPRTVTDSEPYLPAGTSVTGEEYAHCVSCRAGVYFRRADDTVSCSYCNHVPAE